MVIWLPSTQGLTHQTIVALQAAHSGPSLFTGGIFHRSCRFVVTDNASGEFGAGVLHQCGGVGGGGLPFNSLPDPAPSLSGKTPVNVPGWPPQQCGLCSRHRLRQGYRYRGSGLCIFLLPGSVRLCLPSAVAQVTGEDHALLGDEHTTECRRGMG